MFKFCNPNYEDGGQFRDFVYVKGICAVIKCFLITMERAVCVIWAPEERRVSGLAEATFHELGLEPNIRYIDMAELLKDTYQYYTKARISKLLEAGFYVS